MKSGSEDPSKTMQVTEPGDVVCNLCGESCRSSDMPHNVNGLIGAQETGGYGQTMPPDLERWSFDLCQHCFGWLVSKFKIPPTRDETNLGSGLYGPCQDDDRVLKALTSGDTSGLCDWMRIDVEKARARRPG